MKTTEQIVKENNRGLMSRFLPEKKKENEPREIDWLFTINLN